jgi:ABC-type polysaccharide/polyol phosphate transport system ATPase subunit
LIQSATSLLALRIERVFKKFRRGERHDSLRDLIPSLARRVPGGAAASLQLGGREFWALRDVSFEVPRGEAVAIIGHNGAGKSTLLKHISGLMRPTSGHIEVRGRLAALIELFAGFHADLSGRENIYLNGVILGMSLAEVRRKFDEIVEFSGLGDFIDTPLKRYSSGMNARLGFAVAAHTDPDILIVDEVLSVGDYAFQRKCIEKMRSVLRGGTTLLVVSHNLQSVAELCSRTLLMSDGAIARDGPTAEVLQAYLDQASAPLPARADQHVAVRSVTIRDASGRPRVNFIAGDHAWIEVEVHALRQAEMVACVLELRDGAWHNVFNTSSERLGQAPVTLAPGATCRFRFELQLHLSAGLYYLAIELRRHGIQRVYDRREAVASLVITSPIDSGGGANLYARVLVG